MCNKFIEDECPFLFTQKVSVQTTLLNTKKYLSTKKNILNCRISSQRIITSSNKKYEWVELTKLTSYIKLNKKVTDGSKYRVIFPIYSNKYIRGRVTFRITWQLREARVFATLLILNQPHVATQDTGYLHVNWYSSTDVDLLFPRLSS